MESFIDADEIEKVTKLTQFFKTGKKYQIGNEVGGKFKTEFGTKEYEAAKKVTQKINIDIKDIDKYTQPCNLVFN